MKEQSVNAAKLGAFVLTAATCLVLGLYYIGSKKNLFHSSISVSADFSDVGGLLPGNNVRFNGIDVGTVSKVYSVADTAIKVEFSIDAGSVKYITQNAIASIGTDGLLGSKLVNISPGKKGALPVAEGSVLTARNPIEMDKAFRTLTATNDNLEVITDNLKNVSVKINNNHSLWHLLTDTVLAENVRHAIVRFRLTGDNTAIITGDLGKIIKDIKAGKGAVGALITDTLFSNKLRQTIVKISAISDSVAIISGNFKDFSEKLKSGNSAIGALVSDTAFVHNLNQSMISLKKGAASFNEDMEAVKYSWPFKKYFRKQKKSGVKN